MPDMNLIEKDIEAIKQAGGNDNDVFNYLKQSGVSFQENKSIQASLNPIQKVAQNVTNYAFPQWLTGAQFKPGQYNLYGDVGERIPGAIRAAVTSPPETQGIFKGGLNIPAVVQGFKQPQTVPYFQQQATDVPGKILGTAADIVNNPWNLIVPQVAKGISKTLPEAVNLTKGALGKIEKSPLGEIAQSSIQAIPKVSQIAVDKIKEALNAGKSLKTVEAELSNQPMAQLELRTAIRDARVLKDASLSDMTENFIQKNNLLKAELNNETNLQVGLNKLKIKTLSQDMSNVYREGLNQAEDVLAKKGISITNQDYLNNVIKPTLEELKNKGMPIDNPAYIQIEKLQEGLGGNYINKKMTLNELKNFKNIVYNALTSGVKTGSRWADANDQVAITFLKNHGEYIGQMSPELAQLNKEFAPMANARQWASKTFRPFNDAEIQRGANVLQRLATKEFPNETDLNYIKQLEQGSGRFAPGAGNLRGKTVEVGNKIKDLKISFDLAKKNLIDATDYKINQLQNQVAELQKKGIVLKFQRDRLKELIKTRNRIIAIGTTGLILGGSAMGRRVISGVINP